jgi:hypothetical protein
MRALKTESLSKGHQGLGFYRFDKMGKGGGNNRLAVGIDLGQYVLGEGPVVEHSLVFAPEIDRWEGPGGPIFPWWPGLPERCHLVNANRGGAR